MSPLQCAFSSAIDRLASAFGADAREEVLTLLESHLYQSRHGDMPRWQAALESIAQHGRDFTDVTPDCLNQSAAGRSEGFESTDTTSLKDELMQLHPWRKGPYRLGSLHIDTEWRSDWKWDRLGLGSDELKGQRVLDIGCGSGYHAWRMLGQGAELVVGIDPTLLFAFQFAAIWQFMPSDRFCFLPIGIEQLPESLQPFDTIFSMGILYHRRSPIDHIQLIHDRLRPGGSLILETLVVEGQGQLLMPESRYARMRNVWFIPSVDIIEVWLRRCRFTEISVLDVSKTEISEQRSTEWMQFESLIDCLDADHPDRTVEGYPAPRRVAIRATRT